MSEYTIIRNLRGSWPQWLASTDDGRMVYIRIRHGLAWVGVGATPKLAMDAAERVKESPEYMGVSDCVDALVVLQEQGFYYVCPTEEEAY